MTTKYKEYFDRMITSHKREFDEFRALHDEYALNPRHLQEKYNKEGEKILAIIRLWENKLCMQSEKGGYGAYTPKLAEKFKDEIRKVFPQIDQIGIIIQKTQKSVKKNFSIKKIIL